MTHANIELTTKCNQSCSYCSNPDNGLSQISSDKWLEIINNQGLSSVHLTGGEPLLYEGLIGFLQNLFKQGLKVSLLTNGSLPKLITRHSDLFEKLTIAQISLDSTNPEIHDQRRKFKGAHKNALETIEILQNLGVSVEVSMVVDKETQHEIPKMEQFCRSRGLKLILRPLAKIGRSKFDFQVPQNLNFDQSTVVADIFGYGAKSIGNHIPKLTLDPLGYVKSG